MNIKFFLTVIYTIVISTFHIHAMEYSLAAYRLNHAARHILLTPQPHYHSLAKKINPYTNLIFPDDVFDKIIAYSSHNTRKNLKETCTQLAHLTSINRLHNLIAHDFIIGNEKEKSAFFKAVITRNNPESITTIITYAQKKAELHAHNCAPNAVYITIESEEEIAEKKNVQLKKYIQENYLNPLLQEALRQDSTKMIEKLKKENCDNDIIKKHNQEMHTKRMGYIEKICFTTSIGLAVFGLSAVSFYITITKNPCYPNTTICW